MIRIKLSEKFIKNVTPVYENIIEKLLPSVSKGTSCLYKGAKIDLTVKADLMEFLLANDFYNYRDFNNIFKNNNLYKLYITDSQRHKILSGMDVNVCPYCNENYTYSLSRPRSKRTIADLDHFYPKSKYPEYALCVYNFVPACPVCNSKFKSSTDVNKEDYIFPHENSFSNKAHFQIQNLPKVLIGDEIKLLIDNKSGADFDKIENSIKLFNINKRYANHCDVAKDIFDKYQRYTNEYLTELQQLPLGNDSFLSNKVAIKSLIFGKNQKEDDYSKVSLGKMKHDLLVQLRIYPDLDQE